MSRLGTDDLLEVLQLLKKGDFPLKRWMKLGLEFGLSKTTTLDTIENNHPQNAYRCLKECLSKWLGRADNVDSKGGATWDSLSDALRSMDENAVADKLDQMKRPCTLAMTIFDKHHPVLSQSLSDPFSLAWQLYGEKVITEQQLSSVEADLDLAGQRKILLTILKEAFQVNHIFLQKFGSVLCKFVDNVKLGEDILQDYEQIFPSNGKFSNIRIEEDVSSGKISDTVSPLSPKIVLIAVPRGMSEEFSPVRTSYTKMVYNVREKIKESKVNVKKIKEFVVTYNSDLKGKGECTLIDIKLLEAVVEEFDVKEAEKYIAEYKTISQKLFDSISAELCIKERFAALEAYPSLQCETATYVFDWKPDEKKLRDIEDILGKASGKLVKIKYIDTSSSIAVTCTFPHTLAGVLMARVMKNLQLLIDNKLIKLTIGYCTILDKIGDKEKQIVKWEHEEAEKSSQDQLLKKLAELQEAVNQLSDALSSSMKVITELKEQLSIWEKSKFEQDAKEERASNDKSAPYSDMYTGVMHHEKKEDTHWITTFTVLKGANSRDQYLEDKHESISTLTTFKFIEPNGVLHLLLQTPQQRGWTVVPDAGPMKLFQSTVDKSSYSSVSMSVYAEPGVAKDPLHCPVILTGIISNPQIIYIDRPPPPPPPPLLPPPFPATGASQTSRETEESTFRSDLACRVMIERTTLNLIRRAKIDLKFFWGKLLKEKLIEEKLGDEALDKFLQIIISEIKKDGKVFGNFIKLLKEEDTRRTDLLANKLTEAYNTLLFNANRL